MKQNNQQGNGQRRQNKDGQCRRSSSGFGRGTGICRAQSAERVQAESAVTSESVSNQSNLQLLLEQAKRLTKALEEVQAKIKMAEQQ